MFPLLMEWDDLPPLFPDFSEPARWLPLLRGHADLLAESASHTRVTAVSPEDAVQRHYAESLELWRLMLGRQPSLASLVDVGSGGGFPGVVIAAVAPAVEVVLIEPLQKRARLLRELADALALDNVRVESARAEDAGRTRLRDSADAVTARAVAPLPVLLEYTAPLARTGGHLYLPKGSALGEELAQSGSAQSKLGCRFETQERMRREVSELLSVAVFEKVGATAPAYPRRAGTPSKRPL